MDNLSLEMSSDIKRFRVDISLVIIDCNVSTLDV